VTHVRSGSSAEDGSVAAQAEHDGGPLVALNQPEVLLGIHDIEHRPGGWVHGSMPLGPWLAGWSGNDPMAGSVGVLLDDVLGYAAVGWGEASRWAVTTEMRADFTRPLPAGGRLFGSGRTVHRDEFSALGKGELADARGEVVAHIAQRNRYVDVRVDQVGAGSTGLDDAVRAETARGGRLPDLLGGPTGAAGRHELHIGPRLANPMGNLHGGLGMTLCELVARDLIPKSLQTTGVHVSFLRPVALGTDLVLAGDVVHQGRTLALVEVAARLPDGRLAMRASVTVEDSRTPSDR